jgi:hypothetical protein
MLFLLVKCTEHNKLCNINEMLTRTVYYYKHKHIFESICIQKIGLKEKEIHMLPATGRNAQHLIPLAVLLVPLNALPKVESPRGH